MKVTTQKFSSLSATHLDKWCEITRENDTYSSACFHPKFFESCAIAGREVNVSIIDCEEGIAFFPFEVTSKNMAGPVGGVMSDFQGIVSNLERTFDLYEIVKLSGLKKFAFDHLVNGESIPPDSVSAVSPVIDVSDGYESYREKKIQDKSKLFKKIEKIKRDAENKLGFLRYEHDMLDTDIFERMLRLKSAQYVRSNIVDVFAFDWTKSLLSTIFKAREDDFKGVLSCLYCGDQPVFIHFGMQTKQRFHFWFPTYPHEYSNLSPGIIGLDYLLRAVAHERIKAVDLGKGDNLYKSRFANANTVVYEGQIFTSKYEKLKLSLLSNIESKVKQSPLLYKALYPLRIMTRNYRQTRKFR